MPVTVPGFAAGWCAAGRKVCTAEDLGQDPMLASTGKNGEYNTLSAVQLTLQRHRQYVRRRHVRITRRFSRPLEDAYNAKLTQYFKENSEK